MCLKNKKLIKLMEELMQALEKSNYVEWAYILRE